jgi:tight adherence protein B
MFSWMVFLAAVLGVIGIYSVLSDLFLRDRARVSQRMDETFREEQRDRVRRSSLFKDLGRLSAEAETTRLTMRQRLEIMVEQSGLRITPKRLLAIACAIALIFAALSGLWTKNLLVAGLAALVGAALPFSFVQQRRVRRRQKLLSQLPDAFDLMARVIRSGHTIPQGLQAVADEFDPPIAREFSYCFEQQNLGLDPEIALRDLARRTGLLEIKIFVLAMVIQQQTGGNLAELLDKLATVVRERFRLQGKIRTLTAEGRLQAVVLLALPPSLLGIVVLLNRTYADVLIQHWTLLLWVLASEFLGMLWIRRIVNFDF